jgi:excisionase family DNA binding protein
MDKAVSKLAFTVEEACEAVGLGRSYIYEAMSNGRLRSFKAGRRRLVSRAALVEFISAMELGSHHTPRGTRQPKR